MRLQRVLRYCSAAACASSSSVQDRKLLCEKRKNGITGALMRLGEGRGGEGAAPAW